MGPEDGVLAVRDSLERAEIGSGLLDYIGAIVRATRNDKQIPSGGSARSRPRRW